MLKLLLIDSMKEKLFDFETPKYSSSRWQAVFELVGEYCCGIDPQNIKSKNSKKFLSELDLSTIDFSLMEDQQLINLYNLVLNRFHRQM